MENWGNFHSLSSEFYISIIFLEALKSLKGGNTGYRHWIFSKNTLCELE